MTTVMKSHGVPIFDVTDVKKIPKIVQLTKWLNCNDDELAYVTNEYRRINKDTARRCMIAYDNGRVAVFVNDVTNGAFEANGKDG